MPRSYASQDIFGAGAPSASAVGVNDSFYVSQANVLITDAGISAANGLYTYRGISNGYAYYNLQTEDDSVTIYSIYCDGGYWYINGSGGGALYKAFYVKGDNPWNGVWEVAAAVVSEAGTSATNGIYEQTGIHSLRPYYNLQGQPNNFNASAITWSGTQWQIWSSGTDSLYTNNTEDVAYPWLSATWIVDDGDGPAPTVTSDTAVPTVTEEATVSTASRQVGSIGYLGIPSVPFIASYTTTINDQDTAFDAPLGGTGGWTLTIDNTLDYPIGTCFVLRNLSDSTLIVTLADTPANLVLANGTYPALNGAMDVPPSNTAVIQLTADGTTWIIQGTGGIVQD